MRGSLLRCLGHVLRIDSAVVARAMLRKELPGLRPEVDLMDQVGEDMKVIDAKDSYVKKAE